MKMLLLLLLLFVSSMQAATGDLLSGTIVGVTTGVADAKSPCNYGTAAASTTCGGWVLELKYAGMNAANASCLSSATGCGGTFALGIDGTTHGPLNAGVVCRVTGSGYDNTGTLHTGTVERPHLITNGVTLNGSVVATHQLRRIYDVTYNTNSQYPHDVTITGTDAVVRLSLSDAVYSGETVACDVAAGVYNDGTTSSHAATNVSVTNSSPLTYAQAKPIFAWSWPGWTRINSALAGDGTNTPGGGFKVHFVTFHRHAYDARQIAVGIVTATDQHAHSITANVTTMTIDPEVANLSGPSGMPFVQEYVAVFTPTQVNTLTQSDKITVNAKVYPWVGDATSTLDTSDGVNTQPTPLYAPQFYIVDRLGTFGTAAAAVDMSLGNDGTCQATPEASFDAVTDAATLNPCATIRGAAVVIRAYNAGHYTHSDEAGTIYLKANSAFVFTGSTATITASAGTNPDSAWTTITPFPGVSQASVVITTTTASPNNKLGTTSMQKFKGLTISFTSGTQLLAGNKYVWFDGCSLQNTGSSAVMVNGTSPGLAYYTRNSIGSVGGCGSGATTCLKSPMLQSSGSVYPAIIRGNDLTGVSASMSVFTLLGNYALATVGQNMSALSVNTSDTSGIAANGAVVAFNKWLNMQQTAAGMSTFYASAGGQTSGGVFTENLIEMNYGLSQSISVGLASSNNDNQPNINADHNTVIGERWFWAYNDGGGGQADTNPKYHLLWSKRANLADDTTIKNDTFGGTPVATRLGSIMCLYEVGGMSHVETRASTPAGSGNDVGFSNNFAPEFPGLWANFQAVGPSQDAQSTQQTPTTARVHDTTWAGFINYQAWDGQSARTGNGDYHLLSSSPANRVVAPRQCSLPYDMDGQVRNCAGFGSAGVYEGARGMTPVFF